MRLPRLGSSIFDAEAGGVGGGALRPMSRFETLVTFFAGGLSGGGRDGEEGASSDETRSPAVLLPNESFHLEGFFVMAGMATEGVDRAEDG